MRSETSLEEIQSLEVALHRPEVRRSREALEALLTKGFSEIGSSGRVYDRTTVIDHLTRESESDEGDLRAENFALQAISNDAVLLTYETVSSAQNGSKRCVLRSSIWKHNGRNWQMLFHQGTIKP